MWRLKCHSGDDPSAVVKNVNDWVRDFDNVVQRVRPEFRDPECGSVA
jgi:hypothetical protein